MEKACGPRGEHRLPRGAADCAFGAGDPASRDVYKEERVVGIPTLQCGEPGLPIVLEEAARWVGQSGS